MSNIASVFSPSPPQPTGHHDPVLDIDCHTVTRQLDEALRKLDAGHLDDVRQVLDDLLKYFLSYL